LRKKIKITDEIISKIKFYFCQNSKKRATGKSRQVKAKIDICETLIEDGHDIGYTTIS